MRSAVYVADLDPFCSLAQTAVHSPDILAPLVETDSIANTGDTSLLEIYTSLCESPVADPGPYDPDALINARMRTALQGGRAEELQRLAGMWRLDETMDEAEWQDKIGEMGVLATLLACATDPPGADVKVDFFLVRATPTVGTDRPLTSRCRCTASRRPSFCHRSCSSSTHRPASA